LLISHKVQPQGETNDKITANNRWGKYTNNLFFYQ
jgi:hypothetical protein